MKSTTTQYNVKTIDDKFVINFNVQDYFFSYDHVSAFIEYLVGDFTKVNIIVANRYEPILKDYKEYELSKKRTYIQSLFKYWLLGGANGLYAITIENSEKLGQYVEESTHESVYMLKNVNSKFDYDGLQSFVDKKGFQPFHLLDLIKEPNYSNINFTIFANDIGLVEVVGRIEDLKKTEQKIKEYFKDKDTVLEKIK